MLSIEKMTRFHIDKIKTPFEIGQSYKDVFINDTNSPSYAGVVNNEVVAVGGASVMWDGVGEAWYMVSQEGLSRPYMIAKYAGIMLDHIQEDFHLHRLQASVRGQDKIANRFVKWLGFKEEGVMERYGPNKADYIRYARLV